MSRDPNPRQRAARRAAKAAEQPLVASPPTSEAHPDFSVQTWNAGDWVGRYWVPNDRLSDARLAHYHHYSLSPRQTTGQGPTNTIQ